MSMRRGTYVGGGSDAKGKPLDGKTALLLVGDTNSVQSQTRVKAQFDDVATGLGHGWHEFPKDAFDIEPETEQ